MELHTQNEVRGSEALPAVWRLVLGVQLEAEFAYLLI